ncbi:hypothetical protein [Saccharothrix lopnurensis]|uniref:Uncharacterized protein n=1 Tax=Saccharothrix lopnurensis TaxID=1670621 RepID=A0ABW1PG02_9PSEU
MWQRLIDWWPPVAGAVRALWWALGDAMDLGGSPAGGAGWGS